MLQKQATDLQQKNPVFTENPRWHKLCSPGPLAQTHKSHVNVLHMRYTLNFLYSPSAANANKLLIININRPPGPKVFVKFLTKTLACVVKKLLRLPYYYCVQTKCSNLALLTLKLIGIAPALGNNHRSAINSCRICKLNFFRF